MVYLESSYSSTSPAREIPIIDTALLLMYRRLCYTVQLSAVLQACGWIARLWLPWQLGLGQFRGYYLFSTLTEPAAPAFTKVVWNELSVIMCHSSCCLSGLNSASSTLLYRGGFSLDDLATRWFSSRGRPKKISISDQKREKTRAFSVSNQHDHFTKC